MSDFSISSIIYKVILLVLIVSVYWGLRQNPRQELKYALVWGAILAALMLGWSLLH